MNEKTRLLFYTLNSLSIMGDHLILKRLGTGGSSKVSLDSCLAKTEEYEGQRKNGMSVEEHCTLSGFVAEELCRIYSLQCSIGLFPSGFDFIVALHDIGKVSKPFQDMIHGCLDERMKSTLPRHDQIGRSCVSNFAHEPCDSRLKGADWHSIAWIVGSHHGRNPYCGYQPEDEILGGIEYEKARAELVRRLIQRFELLSLPASIAPFERQFLSGLTVVSDWVSSARTLQELNEYGYAKLAKKAVEDAGFSHASIKTGLSFEQVFGFVPNQTQSKFIESIKGPGIYVLEAEMGNGKTEAALYATYLMMSEGLANGFYFALPTRVTSMAIHGRVEGFLDKVACDNSCAKLLFKDSNLYLCGWGEGFSPGRDWFDGGKRSILAPYGVGTIDQALMSVINVRHSSLRAFGLSGKVLIVDELHSYDEYTGTLIVDLIDRVVRLGGTVIVLSATLNARTKKSLFLNCPVSSNHYPLVSSLVCDTYTETENEPNCDRAVEIVHYSIADALEMAIAAALEGSKVLWIENTVIEAQDTYRIIASRLSGTSAEVGLLHSLYTQVDRKKIEDKWLKIFGKGSRVESNGAVLVGTQVLEQSLDIDADLLVSKIAPMDMLLQRMGRLWRHRQNDGARHCDKPVCVLIHPSLEEVFGGFEKAFGMTGYVYSRFVLYRTLKNIEHIERILLPSSIRGLIEATYNEEKTVEEKSNHEIRKAYSELKCKVQEMKQCAFNAGNEAVAVSNDEEAKTRFSEERTSSILILSSINTEKRSLRLLDGQVFCVSENRSKRDMVEIGSLLVLNTINVRTKNVPEQAFVGKNFHLLDKFLFFGDDYRSLGILLKDKDGLADIYGNRIDRNFVDYDEKMGYRQIRGLK